MQRRGGAGPWRSLASWVAAARARQQQQHIQQHHAKVLDALNNSGLDQGGKSAAFDLANISRLTPLAKRMLALLALARWLCCDAPASNGSPKKFGQIDTDLKRYQQFLREQSILLHLILHSSRMDLHQVV